MRTTPAHRAEPVPGAHGPVRRLAHGGAQKSGPAPTPADLRTHLTGRGLASFKIPDELRVLPSLPRTPIGKIDKNALVTLLTP
ncbi:hypothetical protein ACWF94_39345, partial [Streptomyces sp. NPDC055078]